MLGVSAWRTVADMNYVFQFRYIGARWNPEMVNDVETVIGLAENDMTMLRVTHEMGFARSVAHRAIFMDQGEIIEKAPPEEFFAHPRSERGRVFLGQILRL
jgi:general L-amino acid transport system ATP-binding protein